LEYINQKLLDFDKRREVHRSCVRNADNFLPVKQAEKCDFDFPCKHGGTDSADFAVTARNYVL
jgi:hypothetical protein